MKAKAIISAVLLMVCTIASAQTEKKYYMNVQTAPEEVQSYEVNSDLKVSWEQTQKGTTPSGYYSKDEVDAMLQNLVDYYKLESLTIGLTDEDGKHDYGLIDKSREINYLLWGRRAMDSVEADVIWNTVPNKGSILERLDKLEGNSAKPETTPSMELMEENKVLKNKLAELERRLEALEAKK